MRAGISTVRAALMRMTAIFEFYAEVRPLRKSAYGTALMDQI
jgi:hypothetical protein